MYKIVALLLHRPESPVLCGCTLIPAYLLQGLEENMGYLVGDCLLAASFLSYMGPFLSNYRDELLAIWMKQVRPHIHIHTDIHTYIYY